MDLGTALFRDQRIGRLLDPIVQECVGIVVLVHESRAHRLQERRVHRLLGVLVNQRQRTDIGDGAKAGELFHRFLGGNGQSLHLFDRRSATLSV